MLGIKEIGVYIPAGREPNHDKKEKYGIDDAFLHDKIGVDRHSFRDADEDATDMGFKAFQHLASKIDIDRSKIEVLVLVTQNPDVRMPHAGTILHEKIGLPYTCASFDIPLGCSGFMYGLSVITGFMKENGMTRGLLITADPYTKCVNPEDKNTSLLFGDGATATYITDDPVLTPGKYVFGNNSEKWRDIKLVDGWLYMNGSAVVKFVAKFVPENVRQTLEKNGLKQEQIDRWVMHQASRFMHKVLCDYTGIDPEKMPWDCRDYGNTVSSSIPLILEKELHDKSRKTFFICGFGIGLSWGSTVLRRV
ncbi:MAG TPA: ketoacyl-ACP synthase III [bacterium]|nr:ketoacyl-ACP synthase III [bacterium]